MLGKKQQRKKHDIRQPGAARVTVERDRFYNPRDTTRVIPTLFYRRRRRRVRGGWGAGAVARCRARKRRFP